MMWFRRSFLMALMTALLSLSAMATAARAGDDAVPADFSKDAAKTVMTLADKGLAIVSNKSLSEPDRAKSFHTLFVDGFDVPAIGKFVLGRYWRTATDNQKTEFLKLFEAMVVDTYTARFNEYSGEKFQLAGSRMDGASAIVTTDVVRPAGGDPIRVDWRVLNNGGGVMKVVDVIVEGVSMSVTQQQDFGSLIQRSGNGVDGLIAELRQRAGKTQG